MAFQTNLSILVFYSILGFYLFFLKSQISWFFWGERLTALLNLVALIIRRGVQRQTATHHDPNFVANDTGCKLLAPPKRGLGKSGTWPEFETRALSKKGPSLGGDTDLLASAQLGLNPA